MYESIVIEFLASRMKSNGLAQRIHVSEQAYHELKKTSQFAIGYRGIVPLKNRGDMKVWLMKTIMNFLAYFIVRL